jgi:hypothetical protein
MRREENMDIIIVAVVLWIFLGAAFVFGAMV